MPKQFATASSNELHQQTLRQAHVHLERAQDQSRRLIEEHLKVLAEFFAAAKKRTPAFADDVLGWTSKWRLAADRMPFFGSHGSHTQFVAERFVHHLFSKEDVELVIAQAIASFRADIESLEDAMLVALRRDVENLSGVEPFVKITSIDMHSFFCNVNAQGEEAARDRIRDDVVQVFVSLIVTEAVVRVGNRKGFVKQ